jgi:acyl-coenzyme A thioesterase PaaI-like protein
MELKYIRPVKTDVPLVASGSLVSCGEGDKIITVKGELRDNQNTLYAKSKGEFIKIRREDIPPDLKDSEEEIFSLINELPKK